MIFQWTDFYGFLNNDSLVQLRHRIALETIECKYEEFQGANLKSFFTEHALTSYVYSNIKCAAKRLKI